jgi:hypothetical protein
MQQQGPSDIGSDADPLSPYDIIKPGQNPRDGVEIGDGGATFAAGVAASILAAVIYEGGKELYHKFNPTKEELEKNIKDIQQLIPQIERQINVIRQSQKVNEANIKRGDYSGGVFSQGARFREALNEKEKTAYGNLKAAQNQLEESTRKLNELNPKPQPLW